MRCDFCGREIEGRRARRVRDFRGRKAIVCSERCREIVKLLNSYLQKVQEELGEDWLKPYAIIVDIHTQGDDWSCLSCLSFQTGDCDGELLYERNCAILECKFRELKGMKEIGIKPDYILDEYGLE